VSPESPGSAYRLFSLLFLPFWLIHAFWHGQTQGLASYLRQRFLGYKGNSIMPQVWVHASSVGEVIAISPLVKKLRDQGESIFFTSFTASGYQTIQRNFPHDIESGIIPADFVITCRRFVRQHSIKLCLLMETELWPELLFQIASKDIPIIHINARLSEKSTSAPIFVRYLLRRAISCIRLHLTRHELDRQLLIGLGAETENIKIIGNLKSRAEPFESPDRLLERDYLLLASSHESEEALFLKHRPNQWRRQLIVIIPRHPQRSQAIQRQLLESGIEYAVRSDSQTIKSQTEVYLADTFGELKAFMAHASIVIMGGSFDQTGGHNLIEPANLGCAIITGPSDGNICADIAQLGDGIVQVDNMDECWQKIEYFLDKPEVSTMIGVKAQKIVQQQDDVLIKYLEEIRPFC